MSSNEVSHRPHKEGVDPRAIGGDVKGGITDMSGEKARTPEDGLEIRRQVQAFDAASAAKLLREEKTYE